jgi:hypothetical protein
MANMFKLNFGTSVVEAGKKAGTVFKETIKAAKVSAMPEGTKAATSALEAGKARPGITEEEIALIDAAIAEMTDNVVISNNTIAQAFINTAATAVLPFVESLKALGPEGQLMSQIAQSGFVLAESFTTIFAEMKSEGGITAETMATAFAAAANAIQAVGAIMAASSDARIASFDREIEAEKRRDGTSAQSVAKLASLEKKKDAAKKKAFEQDKKMKMASTVMSTAAGIANALATNGPTLIGIAMAGVVAAMGAAQLAIISGTSYQGGGTAGVSAPASVSIGDRANSVDLANSRSPSGEVGFMRGGLGIGNTGATNYVPTGAFAGIKHRNAGGSVGIMTGEQGPEMFIPDRPGTIIPSDDVDKVGSTNNVTFQINAIDSNGVEEVLRNQRGNIIGMLREAANDHGEYFMESVNVREDDSRL